ncbi:LamG domain-containing protein [Streptomyces sp. ALI-76-A]|uniref:LamG domain-containing protein n=1 Tax=Streptomyces sp. ALI-76-A TaxID=3025736 RepID=UPI00256EDDB6|nr:LamG domain-containing protein [Streptomyces sp. ALI-76-A]MDL5202873.1 LamG domain-containing protein [Streptomyces sp. ALI-76-A]
MYDRHRAASVASGAVALVFTLGALPGAAYAAGQGHGVRAQETSLSREGYWPLENAPGGTAPNVEPEGLPLTLNGDAWIYHNEDIFGDPALVDQGDLRLDGDADWAATSAAPVDGDGSFTLAARARLAAADDRTHTVLSLPGSDADRLAIRYQAATGKWEVVVSTKDKANAPQVVITEEQDLPDDDPHGVGDHLAAVFDAPARELRFYVNGQLATTSTAVDTTSWTASGGLQVGRSAIHDEYFQGTVDEVRAYSGAATPTMISQMASLTGAPDL